MSDQLPEKKKNSHWILWLFFVLIVIQLASFLMTSKDRPVADKDHKPDVSAVATKENAADSSSTQLEEIKAIADRANEVKESLKEHYASQGELDEGVKNLSVLTRLSVLRKSLADCKSKEEREVMTKAKSLYSVVDRQIRQMYASTREENFMKSGLNVKVIATGKDNKTLKITFALMSQPMVYKFQNEAKVPETASAFGFNKIIYTNGFQSSLGETWNIKL